MNKLILFLNCIMILASCTNSDIDKEDLHFVTDPHSYAQPALAAITHLDLNIDVNFDKQIISGTASYDIVSHNASEIILDSKFLDISKVQADGEDTKYSLGDFDAILGQPLKIQISKTTKKITVFYKTTEKTEALQWMDKQQTADKTHPFLFTQGEATLTRTWIPIQDSPQIRITYNATVRVPKDLMAVMSAKNPQKRSETGKYHFVMKQPISCYLIALAVGDIVYKPISNRTGVYAERTLINKVYYEFGDMEKMVSAAERLYGPYRWEQYDVIVLPPGFPFGGMENPRLTFATPTVIVGDRSLTSLVAHELAHSWSGNLVTNATWDDFWLNEGFTVYFETRIMEELYGKDTADMLAYINRQDLNDELERLKDNPDDTKLKLNLAGRNPDDGMSEIAYIKGYLFLRTLEEKVGRDKLDVFLKNYFNDNAFTTMTTERMLKYMDKNLLKKYKINFNTNEWIFQPWIPDNQAIISSTRFQKVDSIVRIFLKNNSINTTLTKEWTAQEWVYFIHEIPDSISNEKLVFLDNTFNFTNSLNSYITMVWFKQAILHNYHGNDVDALIENFLITVGRRWYVATLYKAFKTSGRIDEAKAIYLKARQNYHSLTVNTIDAMLGIK